ncbi:CopG family transcriptional regulator [Streptomyces monomycini]|uniref:CopG family transcriptional regulator n=1 Tax=Streptomyces monomycini TaxID=371720 RepID=UPI001EEBC3F0|nr:CopG family transcriptional regulator [Streptomyces monomycini]
MDSSYSDLDHRIDRVKREVTSELSDVSDKLHDLENSVDELEGIPRRVDSLEYDLQEAKEETERLDSDLRAEISGVESSVSRLTTRVAALERHLRQAKGAVVADLDDRGGELHALALIVEKGIAAQSGLLTDYQRATLQMAGTRLHSALEARRQHRHTVLTAAAVLAGTPAGDPKRKAAVLDFQTSAPKAREVHGRIAQLRADSQKSERQLAADDALRARHRKTIDAGQRADTKLRMRLRSRLSDVLSGTDLMPVWFHTAFGPMAPARGANDWLDTATDVLAYRATYKVTDPVVALGPPPDGPRNSRRALWYEELKRNLRRWG